jgi:hypothetical protein
LCFWHISGRWQEGKHHYGRGRDSPVGVWLLPVTATIREEEIVRVDARQDSRITEVALTTAQIAELAEELRDDLRRLVPDAGLGLRAGAALIDPRARARFSLILAALERVEAGTYGVCMSCKSPIPFARLAAIPETRTCIDCVWRPSEGAGLG